ncbi:hypothetical protein [Hydrogenophaga sp.]|uniref:hypothetical protein n=1 Tax=Hydrogenophaga sp. TaxID=1904254 RepID=UPI0025BD8F9F|nr:hypothetical protein [Hydrogenophaga sp.]MBT9465517.1 hypothetical protein [Hydrogenophaga sp.]
MVRRQRSIVSLATLAVVVTSVYITGCTSLFDRIADTVLANEVRSDDREPPHTAHAIMASGDRVQMVGGQGEGLSCSLPLGAQMLAFDSDERKHGSKVPAPIALQMRQACAFHDYCYRHGNATYGYSQADCDFMLQQQAFRLCKFINESSTVGDCETNARKVTLGVRLGGFGSFKRARAFENENASTFFEFDPYPVRARSVRVVRIADAPGQWVRAGIHKKAAYHFDIRPSGSLVHVMGWRKAGGVVCTSFELPGSYGAINGPPMVVRDEGKGEDWFVWWKRAELTSTEGHFALLPPGRATRRDWVEAAGGFVVPLKTLEGCGEKTPWSNDGDTPGRSPVAFLASHEALKFSELHPVRGLNTPGILRLIGLSAHSCDREMKDLSPCLVDVVFDTTQRKFHGDTAKPTMYRAQNPSTRPQDQPLDGCDLNAIQQKPKKNAVAHDRYRNYVASPFVVTHEDRPCLIWLWRGSPGQGAGYESGATVRRYAIGKTRSDVAIHLGDMALSEFPETWEPSFITDAGSASPTFVSFVKDKKRFNLVAKTAIAVGKQSPTVPLKCLRNVDPSWLQRPPAMVPDKYNASRSYIVLTRVCLDLAANLPSAPNAALEVKVATLTDGNCPEGASETTTFDAFFYDFAELDEPKLDPSFHSNPEEAKKAPLGRFAERVRGGQMVLADITGDHVPDLVQIAQLPDSLGFRAAVLVGRIDKSAGLRFGVLEAVDRPAGQ